MNIRTMALVFAIVFILIGIAGFIPGLVHPPGPGHPTMQMDQGYGQLLGLFPVNYIHNAAHLGFGFWGLTAARNATGSRNYFRGIAIGYGALLVLGLIPATNTFFGLVPLFGHDLWLHGVLALAGAYFGWMHRDTAIHAD